MSTLFGDANATLTAVPKDLQRASLDFLFTQLKDFGMD